MTNYSINKLMVISFLTFTTIYLFVKNNIFVNDYIFQNKIENILVILVVGVAVGLATVIFQSTMNTKLISPSIMGYDSIRAFIQVMIVLLFSSSSILISNVYLNFLINIIVVFVFSLLLMKVIKKQKKINILILVLIGTLFGGFLSSLTNFVQMVMDPNEFMFLQTVNLTSLNSANTKILLLSVILVVIVCVMTFKRTSILDIINMQEDVAVNLGLDYRKEIKILFLIASVAIVISSALIGPIIFLGFLSITISRNVLKKENTSKLLLTTILTAVNLLFFAFLINDFVFNFNVPLSAIIDFAGGIVFIGILVLERKYKL